MTEQPVKKSKGSKNQESGRTFRQATNNQPSRKQPRKGECPASQLPSAAAKSQEVTSSDTWICRNSACRAVLSLADSFCRRCSCCICQLFDDNKDPSLWLVCTSKIDKLELCGMSCHIECAIQKQKVGVVSHGQLMQLDGSYCCASCGKVSGILEISLSHRLLDGTCRFKELHEIVSDAKSKLEEEVGPVGGVSAKMGRGIVSRLSVAADVHNLCSLAINKADAWIISSSGVDLNHRDSLPTVLGIIFEEVTSLSLVIVLKELDALPGLVKGYKVWYYQSTEEASLKEPMCVFPKSVKRIPISNLQPSTEYIFQIIPYTDSGDLNHSEAKCFTKSVETVNQNSEGEVGFGARNNASKNEDGPSSTEKEFDGNTTHCSMSFNVHNLEKFKQPVLFKEKGYLDGFCSVDVEECCGRTSSVKHDTPRKETQALNSCELDLNVTSVPDLNAEVTPALESSKDEDDGCTLERGFEAEDDAISHDLEKTIRSISSGHDDSQTCEIRPTRGVSVFAFQPEFCTKQTSSPKNDNNDCVSTLIDGSPSQFYGEMCHLDSSYEFCVKIIRALEQEGHIEQEFRMKFLTWFSLRSTKQERRVVYTFIQTLMDEPRSLAAQLVDSFSHIITCKRHGSGLCTKLWH
ncbi:hypothetical protein FEM48_Zijuj06G0154600 [Ziziphus jujuba var. spinosa]|uniref:Fibronectin type-III domain-containing protein n=1 Tax=Ziziphus jujuba var. spinosa TaxID=714518 RepID=A0A978VA36_ZIZJJ|nr:hypothetical protein FEM48_Zijuj06G0154600 [Ziziphus jujuba var. spinosa]